MPLPGRENQAPNFRAMAWSIRWSSGFLKSSWTTLWSMYWTARLTRTRGTPSCSYCMKAIVPVASCSSVWSIRSEIGEPGSRSPSTRCSRRICLVTLSLIGSPCSGQHRTVLFAPGQRLPGAGLDRHEGSHRRALGESQGQPGDRTGGQQRLVKGTGQHAVVQAAVGPLQVLLDEEAALRPVAGGRELEVQTEG